MRDEASRYFDDDRSAWAAWLPAIEQGFPQREIAESAYRFQQAVERREKIIVGVNDFVQASEPPVPILYIDEGAADAQLAALERLRRERDDDAVRRALDAMREAARSRRRPARRRAQPDAADPRRRARLRHGRRDVRRAPRRLGRVGRSALDMTVSAARASPARRGAGPARSVSSSPSPGSTGTIAAPR